MNRRDKRCRRAAGLSLVELLVVLAIVAVLVGLLLPVLFRGKKRADLTVCVSNLRQLLMAAKAYEADHGELPVHMGDGSEHWIAKVRPYVKGGDELFLCPMDRTKGEVYAWGKGYRSSYAFYYTRVHLGPGGSYRQPTTSSPLIGCRSHEEYQIVLGRNDGSIELAPKRRYRRISVLFEGDGP